MQLITSGKLKKHQTVTKELQPAEKSPKVVVKLPINKKILGSVQ